MKTVLFYDIGSGLGTGTATCKTLGKLPDGWGAIESTADWETSYVVGEVVKPRPYMAIAVSGLQLSGVPAGAQLHIDNASYQVEESEIMLNFPYPGTYSVRIERPPYIPFEREFSV